jgi:hypothetical protein
MKTFLLLGISLLAGFAAAQDLSKDALRRKLKDDVDPAWIYDDLPSALAAGAKTGKPILAVFRCVP